MTDRLPENIADKSLQQNIADGLAPERAKAFGYADTIQYQYMLSLFRKSASLAPELAAKLQENIAKMLEVLLDEKEEGETPKNESQVISPFRCLQQEVQTRHAQPQSPGVQLAFDAFFENPSQQELPDVSKSGVESANNKPPLAELKSVQPLRHAWQKERREMLVRQAIANAPESAGPLNPEMLLVKSFSAMQELSPAYMNQFIAYMETLLWLGESS